MKIWVTKYALTKGIQVYEDAEFKGGETNMATVGSRRSFHYREWHRTEAEATARAEEMRLAKIASLEKQLAKLRGMRFGGGR